MCLCVTYCLLYTVPYILRRSCHFCNLCFLCGLRCCFFSLGYLAAMPVELARGRELAELVADHVLGDEHWHVRLAVVNL